MPEVWVMGEMIVEIMRTEKDIGLKDAGLFKGPYPSGAPAIFIDTVSSDGSRKIIFHMENTQAVEPKAPQSKILKESNFFT